MNKLRQHFAKYKEEVVPKNVVHHEPFELELAYYAGVIVMFNEMINLGDLSEEAAMPILNKMQEEINEIMANPLNESITGLANMDCFNA